MVKAYGIQICKMYIKTLGGQTYKSYFIKEKHMEV